MVKNAVAMVNFHDSDAREVSGKQDLEIDSIDFIAALAVLLQGTVVRFEKTAGLVTDSLMERANKVDRDLVITLQDFDRLQQEFVALSDALTRATGILRESSSVGHRFAQVGRDSIAAIAVSDLTERLLSHLRSAAKNLNASIGAEEEVF